MLYWHLLDRSDGRKDEFATDHAGTALFLITVEPELDRDGNPILDKDGKPKESARLYEAGPNTPVKMQKHDVRTRLEWLDVWHFDKPLQARATAELQHLMKTGKLK